MIKFLRTCATWALSIISVVFTFVPESYFAQCAFFENLSSEKNIILNRILVFGIVLISTVAVEIVYLIFRKNICIKGTNYRIKISYGNILKLSGCKVVVPFDECFSTSIGDNPEQIKHSSICGQYLLENPDIDLPELISRSRLKPANGKSRYNSRVKYDSGKLIPNGNYLLMAFAKLDAEGLGRMTRDEFLQCLSVLWCEIEKYYGQSDVCIPILGSGITRMNDTSLTQQELLDIIIASYKLSEHKIKYPAQLRIICKKREGFSLNKIGEYI